MDSFPYVSKLAESRTEHVEDMVNNGGNQPDTMPSSLILQDSPDSFDARHLDFR